MAAVRDFLVRMGSLRSAGVAITFSFALHAMVATPAAGQTAKHPLDGLTASEYWSAYEVLQASGKVDQKTRYPRIQLKEPPKEEVLAWKPGQSMRRGAFVVVKQGAQTFEAVVDVNGKKLISWTEVKGVEPNFINEEEAEMEGLVKEDAEVQAALKRRGITDLGTVSCAGYDGYFGTPEEQAHRLFRVLCFKQYGPLEDWNMSIEGLTILWDRNEKKVLRVIDTGIVPVAQPPSNYDLASVGSLRAAAPPKRWSSQWGLASGWTGRQ